MSFFLNFNSLLQFSLSKHPGQLHPQVFSLFLYFLNILLTANDNKVNTIVPITKVATYLTSLLSITIYAFTFLFFALLLTSLPDRIANVTTNIAINTDIIAPITLPSPNSKLPT